MADEKLPPDGAAEKRRAYQREYDRRRPPRPPLTDAQRARKRVYNLNYMRMYKPKHPRVYTEAQLARKREYHRKWRSDPANHEKIRAIREKPIHREKAKEWKRKQRKDLGKIEIIRKKDRIMNTTRRARLAGVENTFTKADWETLVARSKHCHWCKEPFTRQNPPTHDHVIPISKGGPNTLANSCCAHKSCNCRKHVGLYNPTTGQGILL